MNRMDGHEERFQEEMKVVKNKRRVAKDFDTKEIEGATTVGACSMMQVMGQERWEIQERESAGSRQKDVALLLVKVEAERGPCSLRKSRIKATSTRQMMP